MQIDVAYSHLAVVRVELELELNDKVYRSDIAAIDAQNRMFCRQTLVDNNDGSHTVNISIRHYIVVEKNLLPVPRGLRREESSDEDTSVAAKH